MTSSAEFHPSQLWEGFWGVQMLHAGQSLGLFEALEHPRTPGELAEALHLEARYAELWCHAALACKLLTLSDGRFQTPPALREWTEKSRGFTQSHLHLAGRMNETLQAVFSGRALPEPPISLRLMLQESLLQNYRWLFDDVPRALPLFAKSLQEGTRLLEVGCGIGLGLGVVRDYYSHLELYGLEVDYDCAREAERATRAVIHLGDLPGDRFGKAFDIIVCFRALAVASRPEELLAECSRLLAPGGWLVLGLEIEQEGRKGSPRATGEHFAYQVLAGESQVSLFDRGQLLAMIDRFSLELVSEVEAPDWGTPLFLCTRQGNSTRF